MHLLYGIRANGERRLVATFDSAPQLLSYVQWATLRRNPDGTYKFEQNTPLVGCVRYDYESGPDIEADVPHNPSPSML
jgi:hypothetical protein